MSDWELDTPPKKPSRPDQQPAPAPGGRVGDAVKMPPVPRYSGQPSGGASPAPSLPRRSRRALAAWVGVALACLLIGALIGFFVARSQQESDSAQLVAAQEKLALVERALAQAEERNWMYYRETESLTAQLEDALGNGPASPSTTSPAPGPGGTYGDGVYLVGVDIQPGTYQGTVTGEVGYWARLRGTDGVVGSIIANALPRGPFVLTVIQSDKAVELRGVTITAQ